MSTKSMLNKDVSEMIHREQDDNSGTWVCQYGMWRSQRGVNSLIYSNMSIKSTRRIGKPLVNDPHRIVKLIYRVCCTKKSAGRLQVNVLHTVEQCSRPLADVLNDDVRQHLRYESIALNTFLKYITLLTKQVQNNIKDILVDCVALMLDEQASLDAQ